MSRIVDSGLSPVAQRDRRVILASLLLLVLLAWLYLWNDAARLASMPASAIGMEGGNMAPAAHTGIWQWERLSLTFLMWAVMMVGMMLPSAMPAILLYGKLAGNRQKATPLPCAWLFITGYLAIWSLFSLIAMLLQATFQSGQLLSPMLTSSSTGLSAVLLMVAGLYQWLPLKGACLQKCRSPLPFFLMHWRSGNRGAFSMGVEHGLSCVGCCWALMLLLFVAGIMNLLWVAAIAIFVLLEKLFPWGQLLGRVTGVGLVLAGIGLLSTAI